MSDAAATTSAGTRAAIADLLSAIQSRDLRNVARVLHPDVSWRNVPHPPTVGRDAVVAVLGGVLTWSDQVQWDVVSDGYEPGRAWLERVDRFLIDGDWLDVRCNGVIDHRCSRTRTRGPRLRRSRRMARPSGAGTRPARRAPGSRGGRNVISTR